MLVQGLNGMEDQPWGQMRNGKGITVEWLAKQLEQLTHLEARVTILGYVQRGGIPSAGDRMLATRLGTKCVELIEESVFGVMVAARGESTKPVPVAEVAGNLKTVPPDHSWVESARRVGTTFGN